MRNDYPRPTLTRGEGSFMLLNGEWLFCDGNIENDADLFDRKRYPETINVPFVPESRESGLGRYTRGDNVCYMRDFTLNAGQLAGRVIFRIGAVDYFCEAFVNGKPAGIHSGGYVPCEFDITGLVREGVNTFVLRVTDHTWDELQPSGKQCESDKLRGCVYTRCTGIWQTAWTEFLPMTYIDDIFCKPDVGGSKVDIEISLAGDEIPEVEAAVEVSYRGEPVARGVCRLTDGEGSVSIGIKDPVLWDIGKGELYDVTVRAGEDTACTYFGMRSIGTSGKKILLNGRSIFMRLLLDQGYNPEGIYTAPDAGDFKRDIERMQAAGFNGARMHMKIFEPGYIRAADEAGFILWGEYPNWGLEVAKFESTDVFAPEWAAEILRDRNCPSIIGWCPFNEMDSERNAEIMKVSCAITRELDPTRLFIDASGWTHRGQGDVYDVHDYEQDPDILRERYAVIDEDAYISNLDWGNGMYNGKIPYFVSEFGGAGYDIDKEQIARFNDDNPETAWGYGDAPKSREELFERFKAQCEVFLENPDICGFCYTQFCDVMQEVNGVYTFDRRPKFDLSRAKAVLDRKAAIED